MPVLYGHSANTDDSNDMSDITQFTKWFHLNDMDFQLSNIGGHWKCTAWKRGTEMLDGSPRSGYWEVPKDYWASGHCKTANIAMLRCYESVRYTQRKGL